MTYFSQAIAQAIEDSGLPLVTEFSLYRLASPIVETGEYAGRKVSRVPSFWHAQQARAMIRTLAKRKALVPDDDFRTGVWHVVGALQSASAEEAICLVDPFAYISHLSAMHRFGITERAPESLHITTPSRALWTVLREEKTQMLFGDRAPGEVPTLARIGCAPIVRRRPVVVHESKHPAEPTPLADNHARIAPIGRIFCDMLDQPQLCGGMHHVLDCFDRHAENWLEDIATAVDNFDSPIVKVRAGYILLEWLELECDAAAKWVQFAQRGGSRKLDPHAPYGATFSEKWMIALNV
ncbi:MAG: hypothetical protein Q8R81_02940 [Novosphingobium sp.]|uniref:hypothetical protein n=1 Tax=Novosphingobium sp. TaxID=1874826 RepID=UPI0027358828|nr:hypothetical protein [Novosphingobium sp.]MDP3549332.1 hypothetical protein [Novosphingobium sp.]